MCSQRTHFRRMNTEALLGLGKQNLSRLHLYDIYTGSLQQIVIQTLHGMTLTRLHSDVHRNQPGTMNTWYHHYSGRQCVWLLCHCHTRIAFLHTTTLVTHCTERQMVSIQVFSAPSHILPKNPSEQDPSSQLVSPFDLHLSPDAGLPCRHTHSKTTTKPNGEKCRCYSFD